jgi:hypothetical protein
MSADAGAKNLQASAQQEAAKTVKEKVDKSKGKGKGKGKGSKKTGKRKAREIVETGDIQIPEAIKSSIKEAQAKRKTVHAVRPRKLPGIFKVADDVLSRLKQYRSKRPINFDPADLKDPPGDSAVRLKNEEHVHHLAEVQWAEKEQPKVVEWIVFMFNVRTLIFSI